MNGIDFLRTFMKDRNVASVAPSSLFTIKRVCRKIDFSKRNVVVEYGPGTGAFTKYLLDKLSRDSKLIVLETNKEFVDHLRTIPDPRLEVCHRSAADIQDVLKESGEEHADYVISGIPFSFLDKDLKRRIITSTRGALREEGKFLVYQFSFHVKPYLKESFHLKSSVELINIPPLAIMEAVKMPAAPAIEHEVAAIQ